MSADVFIMSKSSFSIVPALLSTGVVVYPRVEGIMAYTEPLRHWIVTPAAVEWPSGGANETAMVAAAAMVVDRDVDAHLRTLLEERLATLRAEKASH